MKIVTDSLGQVLAPEQKVISTLNEDLSIGVIEEITNRGIVVLRRVRLYADGRVGKIIKSRFQYGSKLTVVESFDFLPDKYQIPIKVELAI